MNVISPGMARKMTAKGKKERIERKLQQIFSDIERNANNGYSQAGPYSLITELTDGIPEMIKDLGYEIKQIGIDGYIVW